MSLQSIVAEIKKTKPYAEEDVNSGPVETLSGRRGRKNKAVEDLKRLKRDYKQEMLLNAMFIVVHGTEREAFAKMGKDEFGLFSADSNQFYQDLGSRVPTTLYLNKSQVSNTFDVLGRHLEDKMRELDINEYNQLLFKAKYAKELSSKEMFVDLIRQAVNEQIGSEIVGVQAVSSLLDEAIEKSFTDKIMPIILVTENEQLAESLTNDLRRITQKVFLVLSGESSDNIKKLDNAFLMKDNNKSTIGNALKLMKKQIK